MLYLFSFFFSSRRRHTRYIGDWSSDVCSSDLESRAAGNVPFVFGTEGESCVRQTGRYEGELVGDGTHGADLEGRVLEWRSEERRVGKECRSRWWVDHERKKQRLVEDR